MNRDTISLYMLLLIVILLELLHIYVETTLAIDGTAYANLEYQITQEQRQNMLIEEEVLKNESLINIAAKAKKMGFVDAIYEGIR